MAIAISARALGVILIVVLFGAYLFGIFEYLGCGFCPEGRAKMVLRGMGCLSGDYIIVNEVDYVAVAVPCGESGMVNEFSDAKVPYAGVVVVREGEIVFSRKVEGDISQGLSFAPQEVFLPDCGEEIWDESLNSSYIVNCSISFPYGK